MKNATRKDRKRKMSLDNFHVKAVERNEFRVNLYEVLKYEHLRNTLNIY